MLFFVSVVTALHFQTCCWCCTWWACCPCPRTRPGCRLARRQRSSPTQTSGGSPMSWSMKSSVSKTHDNKLTVNLYLVAGPGIPNNQLSVQRPADLLIVVKIKMSHFFSMSQQFSHLCTKFAFPKISTIEFTSKSIWCQRWDPPHVCCHRWSDNRSPEYRFHPEYISFLLNFPTKYDCVILNLVDVSFQQSFCRHLSRPGKFKIIFAGIHLIFVMHCFETKQRWRIWLFGLCTWF